MSNVTFETFVPHVAVHVADCPDLVVMDSLRKTANEFCRETSCWVITNDPISADEGVALYDIDAPNGTIPVTLLGVTYDTTPLMPATHEQLDRLFPDWTQSGTPSRYLRTSDTELQLVLVPDQDVVDAIVTRVAVAPDPILGTGVDSDITNKYFEAITFGALSRLMFMPGTKWANAQLAKYFYDRYCAQKNDARAVAYAANSSAQLRVRGRRFV